MKQVKHLLFAFLLITTVSIQAQVGIGTATPAASAQLDVTSTTKGLLIPRMTATQKAAVSSPATGLLIYQTDSTQGFYYYDGALWNLLTITTNAVPYTGATDTVNLGAYDLIVNGITVGKGAGNMSRNTATGLDALKNNTTGNYNTASGYEALFNNTIGSFNTAIGDIALSSNTTGSTNIAIGGNALSSNTTGYNNTALGVSALSSNTTGHNNTALGVSALSSNTTGNNNTAIGYSAEVPNATGDNQVIIGNSSVTYAGVQVAWSLTSDKRWKSDIKQSALGLDFIKSLNPVSYFRNNDEKKKTEYGFVAQELETALNKAGAANNSIISKDDAGMYSVRYNDLLAPMVKAIQEMNEMNKAQQKMIEEMKKENQNLKSDIEKIKTQLGTKAIK